MATETQKRKQTLEILDKLRMPGSSRARNEFTGEELPMSEEEAQADFDEQREARVTQSLANKGQTGGLVDSLVEEDLGVSPGSTGLSPAGSATAGMVPYSPEEFERRSSFSRLEKPEAKRKRKEAEEGTDEPVDVNAQY